MTQKKRLLVVDDDLDLQSAICQFFESANFDVICFSDARQALSGISEGKYSFDVIISDLMLPQMSGIEFTKRLGELGNITPVIIITASTDTGLAVEAISAGAYDFVVKPINFSQLLVSVDRALDLAQIKIENQSLKSTIKMHVETSKSQHIVGRSQAFTKILALAERLSTSKANVLISGESGSGKEVIAKHIHEMGNRNNGPFIVINCSAIPENLLESELFGHTKGSFTGALEKRIGLFEEASGGTLFLDEIGDLSPALQAKFLRVLQERKIKRIGENIFRPIDVRILSATHKDLRQEIINNRFREDLFYRLNVIPIHVPSLRERKEDILPLAEFFLKKFAKKEQLKGLHFSESVLGRFEKMMWPGNVRELENCIERAVVLAQSDTIELEDISNLTGEKIANNKESNFAFTADCSGPFMTVDDLVNRYVMHILKINGGAKDKTAKDLQIDRKTLYRRISEFELQSEQKH